MLFGDFIVAMLSLGVALYFWALGDKFFGLSVKFLENRPPEWYWLMPVVWLVLLVELYDIHKAGDRSQTVRGIATAALAGLGLYLFLYFTATPRTLPRRGVASFFVAATLLTLIWRFTYIRLFTLPSFQAGLVSGWRRDRANLIADHTETLASALLPGWHSG